jgi:hypothetical protein
VVPTARAFGERRLVLKASGSTGRRIVPAGGLSSAAGETGRADVRLQAGTCFTG